MTKLRVCVLGSTGSIGVNTLVVMARHPDRYELFALSAHSRVDELAQQCLRWRPRYAVLPEAAAAADLRRRLAGSGIEVLDGAAAMAEVAAHPEVDVVMAAIDGAAGLAPCLAAARAGKRPLLANKEALVVGGALFMRAVEEGGATLLPIDSEHSAICVRQDKWGSLLRSARPGDSGNRAGWAWNRNSSAFQGNTESVLSAPISPESTTSPTNYARCSFP